MDNKLQQLTQRLFEEGLEKGRTEAEKRIAEAEAAAAKIVADARREAEEIVKQAELKAEDTAKNTETEIALAGKQAVAHLKSEIASLIVARTTAEGLKAASLDASFLKELMLSVARNWNGASAGKVELRALLPETERARLDEAFAAGTRELLAAGIEQELAVSPAVRRSHEICSADDHDDHYHRDQRLDQTRRILDLVEYGSEQCARDREDQQEITPVEVVAHSALQPVGYGAQSLFGDPVDHIVGCLAALHDGVGQQQDGNGAANDQYYFM